MSGIFYFFFWRIENTCRYLENWRKFVKNSIINYALMSHGRNSYKRSFDDIPKKIVWKNRHDNSRRSTGVLMANNLFAVPKDAWMNASCRSVGHRQFFLCIVFSTVFPFKCQPISTYTSILFLWYSNRCCHARNFGNRRDTYIVTSHIGFLVSCNRLNVQELVSVPRIWWPRPIPR